MYFFGVLFFFDFHVSPFVIKLKVMNYENYFSLKASQQVSQDTCR